MTRDEFVRRASLAGVIVSTAVLSYSVLQQRAEHIGFPFWASFLYPIGLDALIVGASRTWQDAQLSKKTRRLAMWMTLAAIGAGIAAFIVEFRDLGWEAVAFAILIPSTLAAALVLTSWAAADRLANAAEKTHGPAVEEIGDVYATQPVTFEKSPVVLPPVEPTITRDDYERDDTVVYTTSPASGDERQIDAGPSASEEPKVEKTDIETRRAWVREQLLAGKNITGADVDRQFSGARNGARLVRQVREQIARERGMT